MKRFNLRQNSVDTSDYVLSIVGLLLGFVLIAGILANLFAVARGSVSRFSFGYFLELINNYQSIVPKFTLDNISIAGNWGLFDFLRVTFEYFANGLQLLGFLALNLLNLLKFLLYFITGIFSI